MCSPASATRCAARDTFTLSEMGEDTLRVLRKRKDIACMLVNPLQALHPNAAAPSDWLAAGQLAQRRTFDRAAYTAWLQELRSICDRTRHRADLR